MNHNKRVIHLVNGEFYAGAERVQDILAQKLPRLGYDVKLACLKPDKFLSRCQCNRDMIIKFPMRSRIDLIPTFKIARYIRKKNIVLIHAHIPRTVMIGRIVSIFTNVPLIYHVHSPTLESTHQYYKNKVNSVVEDISIKGIIKIITVSKSLKKHLIRKGFDKKKISVVPNGVPTTGPLEPRKNPNRKWTIGMIALFRPLKGVEVLLKALSLLLREKNDIQLRLIGPFESNIYKTSMEKLARELDIEKNIKWVGFKKNIIKELKKIDILAFPSLYAEGMPMVIIEAMGAGVPLVCSKLESIPEIIRQGVDGLLVKPGDPEDLEKAISVIIEDTEKRSMMRKNAYNRQVAHFSDIVMAKNTAKIYDQILEQ